MKFLKKIADGFLKIKLKFQLLLIGLVGIIGLFLYIYFNGAQKVSKKDLQVKLAKTQKQTELAHLEADGNTKVAKIKELDQQEKDIRAKIEILEQHQSEGKDLTMVELEDFFNKRGF